MRREPAEVLVPDVAKRASLGDAHHERQQSDVHEPVGRAGGAGGHQVDHRGRGVGQIEVDRRPDSRRERERRRIEERLVRLRAPPDRVDAGSEDAGEHAGPDPEREPRCEQRHAGHRDRALPVDVDGEKHQRRRHHEEDREIDRMGFRGGEGAVPRDDDERRRERGDDRDQGPRRPRFWCRAGRDCVGRCHPCGIGGQPRRDE